MRRLVLIAWLLSTPLVAAPLDIEPEDLRSGLVAEYRSLADAQATLTRVDAKPAFHLGRSSPHPRLPSGPFEVNWTGVISIRDAGPIAFSAFVGGELTVTIDGVAVLDGRGTSDASQLKAKEPLKRESGYYPLRIRYRSLADVPARLQLWWEGPGFAARAVTGMAARACGRGRDGYASARAACGEGSHRSGPIRLARCHAGAIPGVSDPAQGPSLADSTKRLGRQWLLHWLADPAKVRPEAHMPALFSADRSGFVERWIIADALAGSPQHEKPPGDHRQGRLKFMGLGCFACHFVPDIERAEQRDLGQTPFIGLADRFSASELATFLGNPHGRYPDGRMPRLPIAPDQARDIAAFLLLWSKPSPEAKPPEPPTPKEIQDTFRRLGVRDQRAAAAALLNDKGCSACHTGLGESRPREIPIQSAEAGCLGDKDGPRFALDADTKKAIAAYLAIAAKEKHPSPFAARQRRLQQVGCLRCHQRDSDRPPPIEEAGSNLGGAFLQEIPFLKTPRLTNPHQKLMRTYMVSTVREGVIGLRWSRYTYRMPSFGPEAEALVQALAEGDGELPAEGDAPEKPLADPTIGTLHGSRLTGFQGYACVSCHVWNGKLLTAIDPGAIGPDLTRTTGRIRREWFDKFVEATLRYYPNTPMPSIFQHGKPASLSSILDGDAAKQKEAIWAYLMQGKDAPSPQPPPPLPIAVPEWRALVAQIPIRFADGKVVESVSMLTADADLLVYDLSEGGPHTFFTGAQVLRNVQGRVRQFLASGTATNLAATPVLRLVRGGKSELPTERIMLGYHTSDDSVCILWRLRFGDDVFELDDTLRLWRESGTRRLGRELRLKQPPKGAKAELRTRIPPNWDVRVAAVTGEVRTETADGVLTATLTPDREGFAVAVVRYDLPPAKPAPTWENTPVALIDPVGGSLERPGYRAIAYPRPKTVSGEDRVMPGAVAVRPKDGQVFVASLKTGELFALHDPTGDGKKARFLNYGRGLFQDALSMLAEDDGLYVLHRRNLTKVIDVNNDLVADQFERVFALPHGVADTYDYAYGLTRDKSGEFVISYAPYANATLPGSGGAIRLRQGKPPEEIAFGMRNPVGWCSGPDGDIFFTDNQGEWVAANKLCHVAEGRYYGFPNQAQKQHVSKPAAKTTVWVPYGWARSINGVAYDHTGGKFGPFAGQIFMAELMYGGAIIRADVEKVNGVYQGVCFPFWGKGLLGPVTLAFDPKGPLYVGGITEPGWMAQPDRGALFRIDYTGETPFEMQTIRVRPRGFQIVFTTPVDRKSANDPASYRLEHYRYEHTGSYGSPELDRTTVKVEKVEVAADGRSVQLTTAPLVKDRVYLIGAPGVRDGAGKYLVQPTGAYTLNEVPKGP